MTRPSSTSQSRCVESFGIITLSYAPTMHVVDLKNTIGYSGIGEFVSFAWSVKLRPIATNFDGVATQGPRRGRPLTSGSFFVSSFASSLSFAGASAGASMSFTLRDRSRSLPSASMRPGFSLPGAPKRTSFIRVSESGLSRNERKASNRHAAVARVHVTGDERRFVGCEEDDQRCDLLGLREAPHRLAGNEHLARF